MPRKTHRLHADAAGHVHASMRPRPDAAENMVAPVRPDGGTLASMRPRPDAAENPLACARHAEGRSCFNEAAARCRGKQERRVGSAVRVQVLQ